MKVPLRSHSVCVAGLLCFLACCSFPASSQQQTNSPSSGAVADAPQNQASISPSTETIVIPGPLRSFLRMAGISQEVSVEAVLPVLARNSSLYGYQAGRQTEFLVLLERYVRQARELQALADANGTIRVKGCEDAGRLIQVLGYKFQPACGEKNATLVTANPERAFLTIDSGFPLTPLEEALQKGEPFSHQFPATRVPIFFHERDWVALTATNKKAGEDLLDALMHDQNLDRLYAALAKCDPETRDALIQAPGLRRLAAVAPVFDSYGSGISIRANRVVVPAGDDKGWEDLVGARPDNPGEFVNHLLLKDVCWLAAYFDVMAHLKQSQQARLVEETRLKRLYNAYRTSAPRTSAASGVFPKNAGLLILFTSLKWDANGDLQVPGGLAIWEEILSQKTKGSGAREWSRRHSWDTPERLLETLTSASTSEVSTGPIQIFLMLEAINSGRSGTQRLSDQTQLLIANRLPQFNHWFPIFAEFPELDDASVTRFVEAADRIDGISSPTLKANALGAFQADIGIWHILARQGQIASGKLNSSWQSAVQPFVGMGSPVQLFDAARNSLQSTVQAASGNANLAQNEIVDLLAGPSQNNPDGQRVHDELAERIRAVLDDQRLVSLDTLFGLYDGLGQMAHGAPAGSNLLPLAGNLREFEMPRPIFTGNERSSWAPVVYTSRHAELQIRTDLTKILKTSGTPAQIETARGQLTPFLRDTLVGLNYAYYEPPGAEVLHNNPLFVRSHDFSSVSVQGIEQIWGAPDLIGVGATAGGGAYLLGSLADLPYALASTEQDFIAPRNVQALIWREVVPDLLVAAVIPRWWNVSRDELHAAALYQRSGEELLTASATDPAQREKVLGIFSDRMTPDEIEATGQALKSQQGAADLITHTPPSDTFYLAVEFRKKYPEQASTQGPASRELEDLSRKDPTGSSFERLSTDFGVPHPTLTVTEACTLLNMKPFAAFGGAASGLLAESWESNNLYWARLADEMGYSPVMLNVLVPVLTRHMVANIFASNIDDWPALLRAMEKTGDEFRQGKISVQTARTIARE
jgi:hypothetical protein